jgi:hypothetical protein
MADDGNYYYVHSKHENMQIAANIFAEINKKVNTLIKKLYNKYSNSDNKKRKEVVTLLYNRYDNNSLRENSPLNPEKDTSYTINKGDIIAICIRSANNNNNIHDIDTIFFVVLHELTHIAIEAYDHPDEFWEVFKFILLEVEELGIYKSPNYAFNPREYCGIKINYNPRYDNSIKEI